jgi:hypothetical protein
LFRKQQCVDVWVSCLKARTFKRINPDPPPDPCLHGGFLFWSGILQIDLPPVQFQSLATQVLQLDLFRVQRFAIATEKRFSHRVSVNGSHIWSRLMDNDTGDPSGQTLGVAAGQGPGALGYEDYYNLRSEWAV